MISNAMRRLIVLALAGGMIGCTTVEGVWSDARKRDSADAYEQFVRRYPQSPHVRSAQERLEELRWEQARKLDTAEAYRSFIEKHPGGKLLREAERGLAAVHAREFEQARQRDTVEAYEAFVKSHPKSAEAAQAQAAIDDLVWRDVRKTDTLAGYKRYVSRFPAGRHNDEAKPLLAARVQGAMQASTWTAGNAPESCAWICNSPECLADADDAIVSKLKQQIAQIHASASYAVRTESGAVHDCFTSFIRDTGLRLASRCTDKRNARFVAMESIVGQTGRWTTNAIPPAAVGRWTRSCD